MSGRMRRPVLAEDAEYGQQVRCAEHERRARAEALRERAENEALIRHLVYGKPASWTHREILRAASDAMDLEGSASYRCAGAGVAGVAGWLLGGQLG